MTDAVTVSERPGGVYTNDVKTTRHHLYADEPVELERHRAILKQWIADTGDQGQGTESDIGLLCALKRWGDKCVNPEYKRVAHLTEPKREPKRRKRKK